MGMDAWEGWKAPLEWAKSSPWRQSQIDQLSEGQRLAMAAIVANGELSAGERRLAKAFRSAPDLADWLMAGTRQWGVDIQFAPMRELERARHLEVFLSSPPADSAAAKDWRRFGRVGALAPSNAFALMFKRRELPAIALAAGVGKSACSLGALSAGSAFGPLGVAIGVLAAVVAKGAETAWTDQRAPGGKRELWALRMAFCSDGKIKRLAQAARERARALGYEAPEDEEAARWERAAAGRSPKELLKEAKALEAKKEALLKGGLLSALDQAGEAEALGSQANRLREAAEGLALGERRRQNPSVEELMGHLRAFELQVYGQAVQSMEPRLLRAKSLARVEGEQIAQAAGGAAEGAGRGPAAGRASRL